MNTENEINAAWQARSELSAAQLKAEYGQVIETALEGLESGSLRVSEPVGDTWQVNEWLKKAVLLYFTISENQVMPGTTHNYWDKVPCRFNQADEETFKQTGARVVPPATIRKGAFLGRGVVCMPSYVNIGAYVGAGTMVDTWATVGSCAQIGENVHLSGGVGIGGVLEPLQASPTIIEDGCFIGARSEVVEGVRVGKGSVISMGVFLGQSTKIYDRETDEVTYGYVPPGSVVVAGTLPAENGKYALNCAVIVKKVDEKTRAKTSINELLRS
ncbi:2,3,4,5-tetrahydropyridine-2,6-dicarboxylate N-succinyltransferase [Marinicella sp. S1101]|uniref:2,3,4,5-tetrahydropyridine-2,6-dicarboxylate N-succinyltransferase n=1 Tax=Marinicella marina TaxID=2996016 RepID=UPI0022608F22|nr:2,3,4,5-tetrahydropyridine-2,6-dicarboxylate N-succinyltransferase [Marinicella marina]MCX7554576.1 2,3,4,5-tetrahydropyridine-2,6-dicarboxylate N-succinyltransferase [Marinicella marina]MDJ1141040.1 2,3,4,5-tetrahydropyridine-2,6-dicarboxylate N-succinyltransferase [Marinicella marina]